MQRCYSTLAIKSVNEDERIIEGIASTPSPDRMDDIVEPMGAKFALPLPFLWQHRHDQPIGHVEYAKPNKNGIPFRVRLAKVDEPGELKTRLDAAWQAIKAKLVRAVSIGFRVLAYEIMKNGGWRITEWEWLELSAVTIPANAEATITNIKSYDRRARAATGNRRSSVRETPAGVSARTPSTRKDDPMDPRKKLAELEVRRAELAEELKSFGDVTDLDDEQSAEFDAASEEFEEVEKNLTRVRRVVAALDSAKTVDGSNRERAIESRSRVTTPAAVKNELPKGTLFARYAMAVAAGKGSISDTMAYAKRWDGQTPEVGNFIKAIAGSATPASPGWGSELAQPNTLVSEFIDLLMPKTVIGRINGFDMIPFNVRIIEQLGGAAVNWVGELAAKPVGELEFGDFTMPFHKIAGIVVMSDELVKLSNPSAEEKVRNDLVKQIVKFMDLQFLDPAITATAARPASVTQGVAGVAASGFDGDAFRYDLNAAMAPFDTAEIDLATLHFTMPGAVARGLSNLRNPLGQKEFPDLNAQGGSIDGFPVVVSNSSPAGQIGLVVAGEIAMADDGSVALDASNQATLDLAGGNDPDFSLWQKNAIAIRAERGVTWKKKRAAAVNRITGAAYGPQADSSPA